jgi:hypothetical protein
LHSHGALERLIVDYNGVVADSLRCLSRRRGLFREDLLEDALQQVWCELLEDEGHLLSHFNAARGELPKYVVALAWVRVRRLLRAEHRRGQRQAAAREMTATARTRRTTPI